MAESYDQLVDIREVVEVLAVVREVDKRRMERALILIRKGCASRLSESYHTWRASPETELSNTR
jgi:hypothetical protein